MGVVHDGENIFPDAENIFKILQEKQKKFLSLVILEKNLLKIFIE